jgi:hypothetical protein
VLLSRLGLDGGARAAIVELQGACDP